MKIHYFNVYNIITIERRAYEKCTFSLSPSHISNKNPREEKTKKKLHSDGKVNSKNTFWVFIKLLLNVNGSLTNAISNQATVVAVIKV